MIIPQPHLGNGCGLTPTWFGLFPVRSPLLGESRLISFPPATEMFHFTGFASRAYLGVSALDTGPQRSSGFPHSGILGS